MKVLNKDDSSTSSNTDTFDLTEKTIFIDRVVKLALDDKIFTDGNVCDELKTVLLAVRIEFGAIGVHCQFHRRSNMR